MGEKLAPLMQGSRRQSLGITTGSAAYGAEERQSDCWGDFPGTCAGLSGSQLGFDKSPVGQATRTAFFFPGDSGGAMEGFGGTTGNLGRMLALP